ncbi:MULTISPECIES: ABC transporter permease [Nocardia]|uniref:Probable D,D-dipeptide transport system permease protein ddpC n=1 Tax=Nocardia farcinica TaxID=37329 RepID=A0A0H5NTW4_NOCFR|nr:MULTISPECIES: ABC transporter permease [Nocardia]AXK86489.1 ABC transporter permease [Nocardia farcinica]PFX02189.1 putative D,D-dipeptide transport system permease protein DdpC [Nocardia farcinica]PFX08180.1 putative D,D-dipeptide transport system permease protein DdpC [Nocardia farcinica]CRY79230.1 Probable D%2CD-dipeptide transport system permease protein ddpC [Nocardia farcinica]SIT01639.1 peptide/nickel transport system permease protein [Nocardia farcinica]
MSLLDARPASPAEEIDRADTAAAWRERAGGATRWLRHIATSPSLLLAYLWVALMLLAAIAPRAFTSRDPLAQDADALLLPPSLDHPFGTDDLGRDQFTRMVHGTALSVQAAVIAVLIGLVGGALIGLIAGSVRGRVDSVLMRVVDIMLAVPSLIVSLAIISALGQGVVNIAIAIGINSTAGFARLMRSEVLKVAGSKYVEASVFAGHGYAYRLLRHVVPNASRSVLAAATMEIGSAILTVAALSFLGLGAPPPTPEWGLLVSEGRTFIATQWWLSLLPGLVITLTVVAVYRIGRSLNRGRTSVVA